MTLPRKVEPELLDGLAASDPVAARARRDLQRVHRIMGTCPILVTGLREMIAERSRHTALRILELGAGDGTLMLRVANALATQWPAAELTLLDRQPLVGHATIAAYARLGWTVETKVMNVADWADAPAHERVPGNATQRWDFIIANLFLHHFAGGELTALLDAIASSTDRFVACEPRRDWLALAGSHLVGAIGASAVTRTDAVLSVHAGFNGKELSTLWPHTGVEWRIDEYAAGPFSHFFRAQRAAQH